MLSSYRVQCHQPPNLPLYDLLVALLLWVGKILRLAYGDEYFLVL